MAATATLLVLAVLASAFVMARLWDEQRRTHSALLTAQQARRYERQALFFTFAASDQVAGRALARIASAGDPKDPAELARDRDFCRTALGYYEEIAGRYRADPEMPAIVAAADHRIGFIRMILDQAGAEDAYRRSIARYEAMLAATPRDPSLRSSMALTYSDLILMLRRTGRADEVLDWFPRLLGLRRVQAEEVPADTDNLVSLCLLQAEYAGLLEGAGRAAEADRVRRLLADSCRLAIARDSRNPAPLNNLAWLLVSRPEAAPHDPARAVELAEQAVAMGPAVGAYRNTLGVAHYRAGEWSAAADALEESMRLRSGGDPYDWLFLAMARRRLGDAAEARRWLDRSLAWIEAHAPRDEELIRFRAEALRLLGPEMPASPGAARASGPPDDIAPAPPRGRPGIDAPLTWQGCTPAPGSRSVRDGTARIRGRAHGAPPGSAPRRASTKDPGPIATEVSIMKRSNSRRSTIVAVGVVFGLSSVLSLVCGAAKADSIIYNVTGLDSNDFVPFENDGTPNRPNGDHMGNQITFAGTARYLDHVQVVFASIGPAEVDTYTLDLYKNDGPIDPNSGLREPGTLIAEIQTDASNVPLPGNGGYGVDWFFTPILVPDTLTAVVSSSYSTTTPGQLMGPFAAVTPPLTGTALNTIWYGDGTPGNWTANDTWAINDGATTNDFDMRFYAGQSVPEPSSLGMLALGACGGLIVLVRRHRVGHPSARG